MFVFPDSVLLSLVLWQFSVNKECVIKLRFQKLKTPQLYETELTKYLAWSLIMCSITNLKLSAASIKRKYCFYNNDKF